MIEFQNFIFLRSRILDLADNWIVDFVNAKAAVDDKVIFVSEVLNYELKL